MDVKKIVLDTEIITLARVLEVLDESPTQAKSIIRKLYDELRQEEL